MSDDTAPLVVGSPFDEFIRYVEREKYRVQKHSGAHALFLLTGKTRYRRMLGEFYASGIRRFLPVNVDERENLDAVLGLTIVIDPVHEHRLEVIGPVSWEAFR